MEQEADSILKKDDDDDFIGEESNVEHCVFPWTIKDFFDESKSDSKVLGTLMFPASTDDESFTLWQLDLKLTGPHNDIQIDLTRLKSQNRVSVFVRFRWEILDVKGNKMFPGSIHAFAYPTDKLSKKFVEMDKLLEDLPRFLPEGNLRVSCELTAYERTVEEQISSLIKGNIPLALNELTGDLEQVFLTESGADMRVSSVDGTMNCHKSILSVRSSKFSRLIEAKQSDDCHLYMGDIRGDVLHAILTHLYLGSLNMYLEHTIPKDLYSIATEYGLEYLKQHLDKVNSNGLTMLQSLDVTWKLPYFKLLILQPKVTLYCPEPNTSTLYDKRWCFKLEFDSSSEGVDISVVRRQYEGSTHNVKFVVRVEKYERTCFEQIIYLFFEADGSQGMEAFMTKDELSCMLSEDTLVLRCSLEVLSCNRASHRPQESSLQTLVEQISPHAEVSLQQMAEDLRRMYNTKIFSDAVVDTRIGRICYHSFMAMLRLDLHGWDFISFVQNLDPTLVQAFFLFLYGGEIVNNKALAIKQAAEMRHLQSVVYKLKEYLFYQGYWSDIDIKIVADRRLRNNGR